jgi:cellulose synthase/poly-beta-1,6-N-acetylglucosamine synthase-like glycosyltransferase
MLAWLEYFLFGYFVFVACYSLLFSLAGCFYRNPRFISRESDRHHKMAVFIPSYKEDNIIVNIAKLALNQSYPKSNYDVIVLADSLQPATLASLRQLNIIVHEVHFDKSTKVKSLQSALNTFNGYDIAAILDADNVMDTEFLVKINQGFNQGWRAIQGQRTAKNRNSSFAVLDGLSEGIANHIYRQGAITLGLSSPIIGSGMAFDYAAFREVINNIDPASVAEDKELQLGILKKNIKIHYIKEAIVYDEKVDNQEVFENQRKRWMHSHYSYLIKFFKTGIASIFKGQLTIFNITILHNIQLPRAMNIGLLAAIIIVSLLLTKYLLFPFWYWIALLGLYALSFLLAIPKSFHNKAFFKAILTAPKAFLSIFKVHFKLKNANKKFIHTPHKQH